MVLPLCSLADACMCSLSSVLVIDMNWIAAIEPWQVLLFLHGNSCSMLCSFLPGTETGNKIPDRDRIPGSRHTAASATKTLPKTRSEVSARLKLSQLSCERDTRH